MAAALPAPLKAFVPLDILAEFQEKTEAVLGTGSCHVVTIRPIGSIQIQQEGFYD